MSMAKLMKRFGSGHVLTQMIAVSQTAEGTQGQCCRRAGPMSAGNSAGMGILEWPQRTKGWTKERSRNDFRSFLKQNQDGDDERNVPSAMMEMEAI